jgi:hypothetical protein
LRSRKGEKTERIERARAHLNQSCKYLENACSRLLRTESRKKWRVSVGERRHRLQIPCYGDERGGSKEPQTVPTPTPTPTPVQVYIKPNTTTVAPGQQFAVDVSVKGTTAQTVVAEFTFDASKVVYVTKSTYGPFSFVSSVSGNDGWGELNKQINGIMAYNIWRKRAGPGWQAPISRKERSD